jgi:hypothetical protein
MGEETKVYKGLMGKHERKNHSEDRGVDGNRMDLGEIGSGVWSGFNWL